MVRVSIIIPTYNRYNLIGATLHSILNQTYTNWECIVVDDGSSDYTEELMEFYGKLDSRIQYRSRSKSHRKGANACRNYGFEISKGDFIQFFDSDDIMVPCFLEVKVMALEENDVEYVISKSLNFKDPYIQNIISRNEKYYQFGLYEINNYNYVAQNINWLTCDFMGTREICEAVRFNEYLDSAQEYNYFSKLTAKNINALILDEYLTLRRIHENTTQASLRNSLEKRQFSRFLYSYYTWIELKPCGDIRAINFLFHEAMKLALVYRGGWKRIFKLNINLLQQKRLSTAFWFGAYQFILRYSGKGHFLRRKFIKAYNNSSISGLQI